MSGGYYRVGVVLALLATLEIVAAPLISTATLFASTRALGVPFSQPYVLLAIFASLLCYILVRHESAHAGAFVSGWSLATRAGIAWLAVAGLLLLIGYATKVSEAYSRRTLFLWLIGTTPLLMAAPVLLRHGFRQVAIASGNTRSVVIAGINRASRELARKIVTRPELGLEHRGFFDDRGEYRVADVPREELLGPLGALPSYAKERRIDVIFIALPYHLERARELIRNLRDTTASVYLIPDISFLDLIQARADDISGVPIIALCESPLHGWSGFKKRATDVVLGSAMMIVALPVMLAIAGALKISQPGASVLFRQRRYGLDGEEIVVYKFRTMTVEENGATVKQVTRDDPRVTAIGRILRRYSLDELPQLVNVLQGRMSLVGPRPHAVAHNEEYRKLIDGYMVRHKMTPGMTGLAQINGCRGETRSIEDMKRRVYYDLDYMRYWSLMLDLKILWKTLGIVFREKAY